MNRKTPSWKHGLEHAALTDVGLRRSKNQDASATAIACNGKTWQRRGHLFLVADGMGGYAAGELAAQMAAQIGPRVYRKARRSAPAEAMLAAMREVNRRIFERGQEDEQLRGMGTTTSALVLLPQRALVAHVGDSRIYRLRGNLLEQLTFDHSLVWELCAVAGLSEAEALRYVPRNIITRCMGRESDVQVDREGPFPLQSGDSFLLCSDGLSGPVENKELGTILRCLPPEEAARVLVDLAVLRGGKDNITVIVVRTGAPCPTDGADGNSTNASSAPGELAQQPFGKAPYASLDCTPDQAFLDHLDAIVRQIRELAARRNCSIEPGPIGQFAERAPGDSGSTDLALPVRQRCRDISLLIGQLRARCDLKIPDDEFARRQEAC